VPRILYTRNTFQSLNRSASFKTFNRCAPFIMGVGPFQWFDKLTMSRVIVIPLRFVQDVKTGTGSKVQGFNSRLTGSSKRSSRQKLIWFQ